jgi:hypothetical protein
MNSRWLIKLMVWLILVIEQCSSVSSVISHLLQKTLHCDNTTSATYMSISGFIADEMSLKPLTIRWMILLK